MQAQLEETQRKMKAAERRYKEEMEMMQQVQQQYRLAIQQPVSERAVAPAVMQRVVSPLVAFPLQSSRWLGAMPLTAMLLWSPSQLVRRTLTGPLNLSCCPGQRG